jgi:hypothetical protein
MIRPSHIMALAFAVLALSQPISQARAASATAGFAVTVRVANACEANGQCGTATVHVLGASSSAGSVPLVTPLAPTADRDAGQRIETSQSAGSVEIEF